MNKQEMIDMLKDPDVMDAMKGKADTDDELDSLLSGIEIGDDDDLESVSKKHQNQIGKLVKYFNKKLADVETSAVEKATEKDRNKTQREIKEFNEKNPGMNNPDVVALMQPLYDKGKSLAECYKVACTGLGLDPKTGEEPTDGDQDAKDKEVKKEELKPTSNRSLLRDDAEDDVDAEDGKKAPLNIDDALSANLNAIFAKSGNPFKEEE